MSVTDLLKARTSIRAYKDKPVEKTTVEALLDAARWSPSGGNLQPWKVLVVNGDEKDAVSRLATEKVMMNPKGEAGDIPIYPPGLGEPYRTRRFEAGESMYELLGLPRDDKGARLQWVVRNYQFFGAPVGLFFVIDRTMGHHQWAHLGMFMQSLALVAQESGLATCMQESWAMVRESLHSHLSLAENEMIYCGMALGYRDEDAPVNQNRSTRAEVNDFASFKGFS